MKKELITYNDPKSPVSEMFRTLRTNIQFMNSNKELKTLLVTSTLPEEGKSWTAANLAITFAQAGKRVLLVDADMRKGRQFNVFNVSPTPGLSNCLSGIIDGAEKQNAELGTFIQETQIENLYIMPAGDVPPNPTELLVSERMLDLVKQFKEIFEITIFDGTPSLILADAPILSRIVDSTIIVTAYNETKIDNVSEIKKSIENIGGNIAGVVINKIPQNSKRYENSYYGSIQQPINTRRERTNRTPVKLDLEEKIIREIEKSKNIDTNKNQNEYNKTNTTNKVTDADTTIDKTQDILNQIQGYLDVEKNKLKNGDNND